MAFCTRINSVGRRVRNLSRPILSTHLGLNSACTPVIATEPPDPSLVENAVLQQSSADMSP